MKPTVKMVRELMEGLLDSLHTVKIDKSITIDTIIYNTDKGSIYINNENYIKLVTYDSNGLTWGSKCKLANISINEMLRDDGTIISVINFKGKISRVFVSYKFIEKLLELYENGGYDEFITFSEMYRLHHDNTEEFNITLREEDDDWL